MSNNNKCNETNNSCETTNSCNDQPCCPIEAAAAMWKKSFCTAKQEVAVEILKKKIVEKWGDKLEQQADATIEAMCAQFSAKIQTAKAECSLREGIKASFCDGDKCEGEACENK